MIDLKEEDQRTEDNYGTDRCNGKSDIDGHPSGGFEEVRGPS